MNLATNRISFLGSSRRISIQLLTLVLVFSSLSALAPQIASADTAGSGACQQTFTKSGTGQIDVVESGGYCYVAFKNTGAVNTQTTFSWTKPTSLNAADVLVIGGGGGGGARHAGGGGAGGYVEATNYPLTISNIDIVVGAGGNGAAGGSTYKGSSGKDSSFYNPTNSTYGLIALGGGYGSYNESAASGGSGGGSGWSQSAGSATSQSQKTFANANLANISFGNEGRAGANEPDGGADYWAGGGGGGAGARGENPKRISTNSELTSFVSGIASDTRAGAGGIGKTPSWLPSAVATTLSIGQVSGGSVYFAGGGGGGMGNDGFDGGAGGLGGGGNGTKAQKTGGIPGSAFTGGGGGSSGFDDISVNTEVDMQNPPGGAGGSGVVLIRYQVQQAAPTITGITGGNNSLSVAFTPASDGITVSGYKYSTDGGATWSASTESTSSPISITGLTNATSYQVQIRSVSSYWDGVATATTNATAGVACSKTESSAGGYTTITFSSPGNCVWAVPDGVTRVDVLAVGGGGGGGVWVAGGGGGGGVTETTEVATTPGSLHTITVGAGGTGSSLTQSSGSGGTFTAGTNGGQSSALGVSAGGGGLGASWTNAAGSSATGGGASGRGSGIGSVAGTGNNGGNGGAAAGADPTYYQYGYPAGGGGGAGGNGGSAVYNANTNGVAGNGGVGEVSSITGLTYGGGGGGGCHGGGTWVCVNGSGVNGGGNGGGVTAGTTPDSHTYVTATSGAANTGGGGGGAGTPNGGAWPTAARSGGSGGSGVVIVRYANAAVSPSISSHPANLAKTAGQSATFSVTASTSDGGTLSYQWQKDGVNIEGATTQSYSIASTTTSSAGNYRVIVTNTRNDTTASTTSNVASLTVSSSLNITTPNSGLTGTVGSAYTLSISSSGGSGGNSFSIHSGTLPSGLTLNASTGSISGTPSAAGSFAITVRVTDSNSATATTSSFSLVISCQASSTIVSSGLVLHLDAGSTCATSTAGIWRDISGNSRNLTWVNSPTRDTSVGGFYEFVRAISHHGTFASEGLSDFTGGFTISFYARFDATGVGGWERIIDFGNGDNSDNIVVAREGSTNRLILEFRRGAPESLECSAAIITDGAWAHYSITVDPNTGDANTACKIYKNATSQNLYTNRPSSPFLPNDVTRNNNFLGESNWSADAFFDGGIGDLAIYNRALSSSEITTNFESQRATYVVTYEYNSATGGNSTASSSFFVGGTTLTLPTPTRTNYTFAGWYGEVGLTTLIGNAGASYSPSSSITLYAKWSAVGYNITYDANGGSGTTATTSFTPATEANESIAANGFTGPAGKLQFIGWNTSANGTGNWYLPGASYSTSSNLSLYAIWNCGVRTVSGNTVTYTIKSSGVSQYACDWFTPSGVNALEVLAVGGGGGGGFGGLGGGGGAGEVLVTNSRIATTALSKTSITIGAGGTTGAPANSTELTTNWNSSTNPGRRGGIGGNTLFGDITAYGGGGGGGDGNYVGSANTYGSGGGGANANSGGSPSTPARNLSGWTSYSNSGGSGSSGVGSGGGGAGGAGLNTGRGGLGRTVFGVEVAGGGGGWASGLGAKNSATDTILGGNSRSGDGTWPFRSTTVGGVTVYTSPGVNGTGTGGGGGAPGGSGLVVIRYSLAPIISLSTSSITVMVNNAVTSYSITQLGSNTDSYSISPSLPTGLSLNTSTGLISGTPTTQASQTTYTLTATNSAGTGTATFSLTINSNSTITFNSNGGSGSMDNQVLITNSSTSINANTFTRLGYTFVEWTTAADGSGTAYANSQAISISQDVTLYAQWTKIRTTNLQVNLDATNLQSLAANSTTWKSVRPGTSTSSQNKAGNVAYNATNSIISLTFDGDADYYEYTTVADSRTSGAMSFEMWINPGNLRNGWNILATRWFSNTSGGSVSSMDWHFAIRNNNNQGLRLNLYTTGTSDKYGSRIFAASDEWMLVGFTIDASGNLKFYVDGVQDGSTHTGISRTNQSGSKFFIGDPRAAIGFPGGISKVRLYGAALSSSEMLANFDAEYLYYRINKVTFNENYGATPATSTQYLARSTATNLTANSFTRAAYNFNGWNTAADGSGTNYTNSQSVTLTEDLILYAKWTTATYAVTYDTQGGTPISSGTFVQGGSISSSPGTPVRAGYTFSGWFAASTGGSALTFPYSPGVSQAITLYAQWSINTYTVTYDSQSGSAISSGSYVTGGNIPTSPGNPTRSGYTFNGWFVAATGGSAITFPFTPGLTRDITIYAQWTAINYNITYSANESDSGSVPTDAANYTIGQKITVKANTGSLAKTGYTFAGWNTAANGSGTTYLSGTEYTVGSANITLYAKWNANTYTITYNTNGASGNAQRSSSNVTSDSYTTGGSTITLPGVGTMAKTGYDFGGWSETTIGAAVSENLTTSSSKTLYARWTAKTIQVTYSKGDAASHSFTNFPSNTTGTYGVTFTLNGTLDTTATFNVSGVATLHQFVGWNDGNSVFSAGASYSLGESNPTFTALWVPVYGVRYNFNGGTAAVGTSTVDGECLGAGSLCTNNQTITANAAPSRTGYTFGGWKLQDESTVAAGAEFTVISTRYILNAQWTPVDYTVTYDPNSGATTPTQASRQIGQTFTVANAISRTGYSFNGWSDGTRNYGPGATYTVGSANVTLTAQWIADVYTITYDWNGGRGSAEADATYTVGTGALTLPLVGDRVKDGFTFSGWSLTSNGDLIGLSYTPTQSRTLYAIWGTGSYTLTYNANGGSNAGGVNSAQIQNGNSTTLPTPTRSNFVFDGWYSASTGGTLVGAAGAAYQPTQSRSIYARWTQASLAGLSPSVLTRIGTTTTSDGVSTSFSGANIASAVSINIPAGALPAGTVVNFDLVGDVSRARAAISNTNNYIVSIVVSWLATDGSVPDTAAGKPIAVTIQNASIKAGASVYKIIFQNGESVPTLLGTATQDGIVTVNITTDPEVVVAITKPGVPTSVSATSNGNLESTVSWSAPASNGGAAISTYTATANTGQSCQTATLSCTISGLSAGTSYTFTVTATNSQGTSDASSSASATTASSYTVTFNSNGGSAVTNGSFLTGGSVTAPANPTKSGYSFMGWSDTDGGSAVLFDYSPGVNQNITLYAIWSANTYTVTFNSKSGSTVTDGSFTTGGSVSEPTAPTRTGYTFAGWSATDGGTALTFPYSPGVTNNITLFAKWNGDSFTVTFNSNGGSTVTDGSFTTGGSVSEPTAPTRTGYTFAGWSATDGGTALTFPYSPGVTNNITLFGKWSVVSQNTGGNQGSSSNRGESSNSNDASDSKGSSGNKPATPAVVKVKPVEVVGSSQAKIPTVELPIGDPVKSPSGVKLDRTVKVTGAEAKITESVKILDNQLVIVPVEGFSGKRTLTVTISEGNEVKTIEIPLVVLPEPVRAPVVQPSSSKKTNIDWKASPNADRYEVFIDGKRVCSTTRTECTVNRLIGPGAQVEIVSNGGDRTKSEAAPADFEQSRPIQVARLSGSTNIKPTLSSLDERLLNSVISLVKKQGFGTIIITDVTTTSRTKVAAAKRIEAIKNFITLNVGAGLVEFEVVEPNKKTYINTISLKD